MAVFLPMSSFSLPELSCLGLDGKVVTLEGERHGALGSLNICDPGIREPYHFLLKISL